MEADHFNLSAAAKPMQHDIVGAGETPAHAMLERNASDEKSGLDSEKFGSDEKTTAGHTLTITDVDKPYQQGDPFPEDPDLPQEHAQFTFRAIFVGCCIGAVVQASNLYLGLKTGFTFGPQLLGGIGGFLVLKPLSRVIPQWLPSWFGVGYFGPKENVACQTAATAAGGLGILFVSGFPAMYQLGLLGNLPKDDIGKLIAFMAGAAFYGQGFAIPFRKFYVLRLKLTFPTPSATAFAIRALHASKTGASDAKAKGKWLFWSFVVAITQKVASSWAPGILYDWHVFNWIAVWGGRTAQYVDNWGWYAEITPAFFGAGVLSGMNASWSFYGGSILAWAIIGPAMVATGRAVGRDVADPGDPVPYISYYSMSPRDATSTNCSPRYNLLWIGVFVMLVSAFVEIGMQYKAFGAALKPASNSVRNVFRKRSGKPLLVDDEAEAYDPAEPHEQVPWWTWLGTLVGAVIITCAVMGKLFDVNVGLSILAIVLGFIFSAMGVLGAGYTDINPVSSVAKASQLVIGGTTHGKYPSEFNQVTQTVQQTHALRINLLAGLVSAAAAGQTTDMTSDMKTGHLLRSKPVVQYWAQFIGAFCAIFLSVGFFILFTTAAPCILDATAETCQYGAPSVAAWRSVAVAVTSTDGLPIPTTAGILAIVLAVVGAIMIVARQTVVPLRYRGWVPNPAAAGLAFVLPQTQYGLAMVIGATGAYIWQKRNPRKFDQVGFSFAAGMIAGEGLGGVVQAILIIAGAVTDHASAVGCPNGAC